jgi:sucrose phosphorylase
VTDKSVSIPVSSVNLIGLDVWRDLISQAEYSANDKFIELEPYGFVWLSNK